jgi:1,4-dihydroxy-2-naphthoate octaprenyltransferase
MKKIITLTLLVSATLGAHAQSSTNAFTDQRTLEEFVRNIVILLMIYMVTSFILNMIKLFLNDRLKRKMVETGTSEAIITQLLDTKKSDKENSLKWFFALTAIAVGLGVIGCYHMTDIYALMIIAICLAVGFLGHYFMSRRLQK